MCQKLSQRGRRRVGGFNSSNRSRLAVIERYVHGSSWLDESVLAFKTDRSGEARQIWLAFAAKALTGTKDILLSRAT